MKILKEQKELEDLIMKDVSKENLLKHVNWLCENVAPRISGTPACRQAAEYIEKANKENGVSVNAYKFMGYMCAPEKAEVKIISPEEKEIDAYAYAFTPPTPPGGLEAEVVAAGIGTEEDVSRVDVKGKICFVKYSGYKPISYNEKIRVAERHGAAAFLHQNWTPPERNLFHYGSAKHVWGVPTLKELRDPTPESFAHAPALCTTRKGGDIIRELLERGPVRMRIKSASHPEWDTLYEPIAIVPGSVEPAKFVLVGGHFDAYGGGATDNAVGNALCLEVARILQKYSDRMRRSVRFGWWDGHETAKQSGSTWYLDNFWDDFQKGCLAYFNVDSPGTAAEKNMTGPIMFYGSGAPIINQFCQDAAKDIARRTRLPYAGEIAADILILPGMSYRIFKAGDQSFLGMGIPSAAMGTIYTPEFMAKVKTAYTTALGWWYHSDDDTFDKVDIDALVNATKAVAFSVARLCNLPVLPFKAGMVADWMLEGLKAHRQDAGERLDLAPLLMKAEGFKKAAQELDKAVKGLSSKCEDRNAVRRLSKKIEAANTALMKLSRILDPVNYTLAGKYGQDRWGDLPKPVPGLQQVSDLSSLDPKSGEFAAVMTGLIRERNKVSDALDEAMAVAQNGTKEISK
jgi:hypothetical protein